MCFRSGIMATPCISIEEFQREIKKWDDEQRDFINFLECEVALEFLEIQSMASNESGGGKKQHEKKTYETATLLIVAPVEDSKTFDNGETYTISLEEAEKQAHIRI